MWYYVKWLEFSCRKEHDMPAKIIQLIDVQSYLSQEVLNVFHFVDPTGVGDEDVLVSDYVSDVIPLVTGFQNDQLTHVAIRHRQVYPTAELTQEFAIVPPLAGSATGTEPLASADALSFKWTLGATVILAGGFTGHIKRGGARTSGAYEAQVTGNTVNPAIFAGCAAWVAELRNPGTDAFLLCVASYLDAARVRQETVQAYCLVSGGSAPGISTQNSRKVLRGRAS